MSEWKETPKTTSFQKAISVAFKKGLREGRWEAFRVAPAVMHYGPLPPVEHVHTQEGETLAAKGYEPPELGRAELLFTCPSMVSRARDTQTKGGLFIWLN